MKFFDSTIDNRTSVFRRPSRRSQLHLAVKLNEKHVLLTHEDDTYFAGKNSSGILFILKDGLFASASKSPDKCFFASRKTYIMKNVFLWCEKSYLPVR